MSDQFHYFGQAVQQQFDMMSAGELFTVGVDADAFYLMYQNSFPAGTNEMFRKQREHECSTCRNFIKNIGNVVSINDDLTINTVWDVQGMPEPYQTVADRMSETIKRQGEINGLFRATEQKYGGKPNKDTENASITWNHFHAVLNKRHFVATNAAKSAAAVVGEYATDLGVFKRGMTELTTDAIDTVIDLINSNNLYKGAENKSMVDGLFMLHANYSVLSNDERRNVFLWKNLRSHGALIRNTAIGTLLQDLSAGKPLEQAVKSYEDKVSGTNYKRPTALITPRMVQDAMKTIEAEGIEPSLHRRLATIEDVAVTDVLYVDNEVRSKMRGGVASLLAEAAVASTPDHKTKAIPEISIEDFMSKVLPKAKKMELSVSNAQQSNFMVLTAPVDGLSQNLFKWDNRFAWSYDGNITDSIKERVKAAGGRVDAPFRISLAWFNRDDLDLHVFEPLTRSFGSGYRIYFGNRRQHSPLMGMLDLDANGMDGIRTDPAENVVWDKITDGQYRVTINNYSQRDTKDAGYTIEVEVDGTVHHFSSQLSPRSGQDHDALLITIKGGKLESISHGKNLTGGSFSQEKWGVKTEQFTRVDSLMLSPNYWGDNKVGNKHFFFVLEGCKTDVPARGIYNEFLKPEFDKHRKVFEVLGNKMMCEPTANQLAGVGFSSTKQDKVLVRVNGHQLYNVQF